MELRVSRSRHLTHPALADESGHGVVAESGADLERHIWCSSYCELVLLPVITMTGRISQLPLPSWMSDSSASKSSVSVVS